MPTPNSGRPKARNLTDDELTYILGVVKQSDALGRPRTVLYKELGVKFERDWKTICSAVQRLSPSVHLAQTRLRAAASRMARHIIQKGSVAEHIEVLSRPNIGVLEPIKRVGEAGGGFFLSVQAESCGAVRVGVMLQGGQGQLPAAPENGPENSPIDKDTIEAEIVPEPPEEFVVLSNQNEAAHPPPQFEGMLAKRLAASRARLQAAREREGSEERADIDPHAIRLGPQTEREKRRNSSNSAEV